MVASRLGSFSQPASSEQSARVLRILDEYMAVLERGGRPDPEGLLARHPDLADVLAVYLQDLEQRHAAAVNLRDSLPSKAGRTAPDPIPETECLGDFQIVREIGRGGMGIVYEAEQLSLGRRVALKVLPLAAALDRKQLQRFQVEAHAAACLHHTNIVPIHAVGCERGVPFYAMQLIEGRSLAALIRELRQLEGLDPAETSRRDHDALVRSPAEEVVSGRQTSVGDPERDGGQEDRGSLSPRSTLHAPRSTRLTVAPTSKRRPAWASRRPRPWSTPISAGFCTATSSRPTFCSTPRAPSG